MSKNKFHIICNEEGKRLDVLLSEKLSLTRTKVKDMIEGGYTLIDGKIPKPSLTTKHFMVIEGEIPEEEPLSLIPQEIPLEILYEDEYFIAVNKPKDMVVHPSFGHRDGTLVNALLAYLGKRAGDIENGNSGFPATFRPGIVHRLDKDTTGVIIVAKNSKIQDMLSLLFKKREVRKTYRAIVEGVMNKKEGLIEGNIGRHPFDRKKMAVLKEDGRDAATSFIVIKQLDNFAYVEAYPRTGRTHQIRVHLTHIGHPVAGDGLYGKQAKNIADRPLLHAYRIQFMHPVINERIIIEAPIPDDMVDFIEKYAL